MLLKNKQIKQQKPRNDMVCLKSTMKLYLKWLKGQEKTWEHLNLLPELSFCLSPVKKGYQSILCFFDRAACMYLLLSLW